MLPKSRRFILVIAFLIGGWGFSRAEDDGLSPLRAALVPLRAINGQDSPDSGRRPTPPLSEAKHRLRDWIESRLPADIDSHQAAKELARNLSRELQSAGLQCPEGKDEPDTCRDSDDDFSALGHLGDIRMDLQDNGNFGRLLTVRRSLGLQCGYDDSAYVYLKRGGPWRRLFETETPDSKGVYQDPRNLVAVLPARSTKEDSFDNLILALSWAHGCASNWGGATYRLWRAEPGTTTPTVLIEGTDFAYYKNDPPLQGRIVEDDALIEYTVSSMDTGVHSREKILHFKVDGKNVQRVAPFALTPSDFVEEWLRESWDLSRQFTRPQSRTALRAWHKRFKRDDDKGFFADFTSFRYCSTTNLWQIGISTEPYVEGKNPEAAWFTLRWQPVYRFEMIDIAKKPSQGCAESGFPDDAPHTLFPLHDQQ